MNKIKIFSRLFACVITLVTIAAYFNSLQKQENTRKVVFIDSILKDEELSTSNKKNPIINLKLGKLGFSSKNLNSSQLVRLLELVKESDFNSNCSDNKNLNQINLNHANNNLCLSLNMSKNYSTNTLILINLFKEYNSYDTKSDS